MHGRCVVLAAVGAWLCGGGATAGAVERVPDVELATLDGAVSVRFPEAFAEAEYGVLIVWSRGCPRCRDLALEADALAPLLAPRGARLFSVLCGPDDPVAVAAMLEEERVVTPQLWDPTGRTAQRMGLGEAHFAAFLVDRSGAVLASFDDTLDDLAAAIVPALDALRAGPAPGDAGGGASGGAAGAARGAVGMGGGGVGSPLDAGLPAVSLDARFRLETTEDAAYGATGLYGQAVENGTLSLFRFDLRLSWDLGHGVELVPWIRASNEDDEALTGGAEQFASRHGTLSLHWRGRAAAATLGAHPLRISPLLLQRWDEEDAPPLGGVGGCSVCAGGVVGLVQRSLEILDAPYTFEGGAASVSHRWARARLSVAVPRWERREARFSGVSIADSLESRYRRTLVAATVDLGPAGSEEPVLGLPAPIGARVAHLGVGDDRRTVDESAFIRPPREWDERGWLVMAQAGPWRGLSVEAEHVWWRRTLVEGSLVWDDGFVEHWTGDTVERTAHRLGVRGAWNAGRAGIWGRVHHLRVEEAYEPLFAALTVEPNEQGWRAAGGVRLFDRPGAARERAEVSVFVRAVEEIEPLVPSIGRVERTVWSVSLAGRPRDDLRAGLHVVRVHEDAPAPILPDATRTGVSADLRWEGVRGLDPVLRLDVVRAEDSAGNPSTYRQVSVMVRARR